MTTPSQYRQFAADCLDWSFRVSNPSNRALLIGFAKQWMRLASEMEGRFAMSRDPAALEKEMRAKLD